MQIARACALLVSLSLVACGDDGGTKLIDSGIGNRDAGPKVCGASTIATIDIDDEYPGSSISFIADLGEMDGFPAAMFVTFTRRPSAPGAIPATVNIGTTATEQNVYTCTTCFQAVSFTDTTYSAVEKTYFAQEGTITFTGDPITTRHLTAQLSGLKLQEATFDRATRMTMFNPVGNCVTLNDAIDQDNVPDQWTCAATDYYSGTMTTANACQCDCGAYDGDCRNPAQPVTGCPDTALAACWPNPDTGAGCVAKPANDTCADAPQLTLGTAGAVMGTTIGAGRHYNKGLEATTCTGYAQAGPDVAYRVTLTMGVVYTIAVTNTLATELDATVAVVGPGAATVCSDTITTCVAGSDKGLDGEDEIATFTPTTTGTYYIIVDSFNRDDGGQFTLKVTSPANP